MAKRKHIDYSKFKTINDLLGFTKKGKNGCLIWKGYFEGDYAYLRYQGKTWRVNRLIKHLQGYKIDGMDACHRCDNPRCVNPDHVCMAPHAENMMDYHDKGSSKFIPLLPFIEKAIKRDSRKRMKQIRYYENLRKSYVP